MEKNSEFSIKLAGPGMTIERTINPEIAHKIALLLFTDGKTETPIIVTAPQPALQSIKSPETAQQAKPSQSLREFLTDCNPIRIPEKIATIGYYLEKTEETTGFSRQDLIRGFEKSKEPIPSNIARDITWTIKIGWIASKHENEDLYYVTKSGAEAVESKFPEELRKKTKASEGGRKKNRGKSPTKKS